MNKGVGYGYGQWQYLPSGLRWHTHVALGKWFVQVWSVPS